MRYEIVCRCKAINKTVGYLTSNKMAGDSNSNGRKNAKGTKNAVACGKCTQHIVDGQYLTCKTCGQAFHLGKLCSAMLATVWSEKTKAAKAVWQCRDCKVVNPAPSNSPSLKDIYLLLQNMSKEVTGVNDSIEFLSAKFDEQVVEVAGMKKEVKNHTVQIDELQAQNRFLDLKTQQLDDEIHDLQQRSRNRNVEIFGIEQSEGENVIKIVETLATKLGLNLDGLDVVHRVPKKDHPGEKKKTIPSIVMQFATRSARSKWLQHRNTNLMSKDVVANGGTTKIFINEHLSPHNKKLLFAAKTKASMFHYQFVWPKDGKIFVKRNESSRTHKILRFADLDRLFPPHSAETQVKELGGAEQNKQSEHNHAE